MLRLWKLRVWVGRADRIGINYVNAMYNVKVMINVKCICNATILPM